MSQTAEMTPAQEGRYLDALRANYPARIAEIQARFRAGTHRRQLIARWGQDIVDLAIAEMPAVGSRR